MLDKVFLEKRIQDITVHITTYMNQLQEHKQKAEQLNQHILKLQGHISEAQHLLNEFNKNEVNKNGEVNEQEEECVAEG